MIHKIDKRQNKVLGLHRSCSTRIPTEEWKPARERGSYLHPIAFSWKEGGLRDVGFAAEEVEQLEPLLTTRNSSGQLEGVKYAQISTVLVNAVNQQQTLIEEQRHIIERHQRQIDGLKKLVCLSHPQTDACSTK